MVRVKNAYQLGRQDERKGVPEKIASSSAEGITTSPSTPDLEPEEKETDASFWNRLVAKNLKASKK